jgi:hypothetical protein
MPRVTLSPSALKALGFDRDRVIRVVKLATGEFVRAQWQTYSSRHRPRRSLHRLPLA